jgi:radical SAM superfamily enzyme YgiQ (UPF0313 family)
MKIVLTTPPVHFEYPGGNYLPPMHLAYIGTSVQDMKEVQISLLDSGGLGLLEDDAVDRIIEADPDVVGLSITSCDVRRSLKLLTLLKAAKPGLTTIIGGHHPTAFDSLFLEHVPQVDLAMRGEVDHSFPELVRRLLKAESIAGAPGLSYRAGGRVVRGIPQVIRDLDSVKFPDRSLLDREKYFLNVLGIDLGAKQAIPITAIITSRGCPHHCTFCSKLTPQHYKYRPRSPENIISEIGLLSTEGYEAVVFTDENVTYDVKRLERMCHLLIDNKLNNMHFMFQGTLHNLSQPILNLMRQAGFDAAIVGVESGSDAQLKRFRKAASSSEIADGVRRARKARMFVHGSFIYGGPGETPEDRRATRDFLKKARPNSCTIYELSVYPGSIIWRKLNGTASPKTLEDTRNRVISSLPGQIDRATIDKEIKSFWKAFARVCFHWKSLANLAALARYNPSIRRILLRYPKVLLQFLSGRQRYR